MGLTPEQAGSFDNFFFYGEADIKRENESDLLIGLLQPKRSLFYNRRDGAGIKEYKNLPNGLQLQATLRFVIANYVAFRNTRVTGGENNTRDRRLAVSQNTIGFERRGGELDVIIQFIAFVDITRSEQTSVPVGKTI